MSEELIKVDENVLKIVTTIDNFRNRSQLENEKARLEALLSSINNMLAVLDAA